MLVPLLFGLLGLVVGSFLNVLILRYPGRSLGGRSACMRCGARVAWYDNVPVLSWIALRGRCRGCGARISIQYPLVEASMGILFALIGQWAAPIAGEHPLGALSLLLDYLLISSLLVAIFVYDLYHAIIPDAWVYPFAALALLSRFLVPFSGQVDLLSILLAGPIAAFPLFAFWLVSRGAWMGLGDAKLGVGIGWLLGPAAGIAAVVLAFIAGGIASAPLLFFSSAPGKRLAAAVMPTSGSRRREWRFTMKSEIPFGPFLIAAALFLWFSSLYGLQLPLLQPYGA